MAESETKPPVKTSVTLPQETLDTLREIAGRRGTTMAEVLRQAISMEKYLQDTTAQGGKILIKDVGNDTLKELVFRK